MGQYVYGFQQASFTTRIGATNQVQAFSWLYGNSFKVSDPMNSNLC